MQPRCLLRRPWPHGRGDREPCGPEGGLRRQHRVHGGCQGARGCRQDAAGPPWPPRAHPGRLCWPGGWPRPMYARGAPSKELRPAHTRALGPSISLACPARPRGRSSRSHACAPRLGPDPLEKRRIPVSRSCSSRCGRGFTSGCRSPWALFARPWVTCPDLRTATHSSTSCARNTSSSTTPAPPLFALPPINNAAARQFSNHKRLGASGSVPPPAGGGRIYRSMQHGFCVFPTFSIDTPYRGFPGPRFYSCERLAFRR